MIPSRKSLFIYHWKMGYFLNIHLVLNFWSGVYVDCKCTTINLAIDDVEAATRWWRPMQATGKWREDEVSGWRRAAITWRLVDTSNETSPRVEWRGHGKSRNYAKKKQGDNVVPDNINWHHSNGVSTASPYKYAMWSNTQEEPRRRTVSNPQSDGGRCAVTLLTLYQSSTTILSKR